MYIYSCKTYIMPYNYSGSKCPKCNSTSFEMVEDTPMGSKFKLMFIRCSHCKTLISASEFFNAGELLTRICDKLNIDY